MAPFSLDSEHSSAVLTIATWNVNSIRARLERLLAWLDRARPDIVCLQELKVTDKDFPREAIAAAGYIAAVHGQRTYNGVAILSREPLEDTTPGLADGVPDPEARFLCARVRGIRVASVYVPNGQAVGSEKWAHKLAWLDRLAAWLARVPADEPLLLAGDLNIAPEDRDVAFVEQWRDTVLTHEDVRARFRALAERGLVDVLRRRHPEGPGPFTWWDYRMLGFAKGNGLRIDHILATGVLAERCREAVVAREERKGKQPSDHAPVVATFDW